MSSQNQPAQRKSKVYTFDEFKKLNSNVPQEHSLVLVMAIYLSSLVGRKNYYTLFNSEEVENDNRLVIETKIKAFRRGKNLKETNATALLNEIGFQGDASRNNRAQLEEIASLMPEYRFRLYSREHHEREYSLNWECNSNAKFVLNLVEFQGRYDYFIPTIKTIGTMLCKACQKPYNDLMRHTDCPYLCNKCKCYGCTGQGSKVLPCSTCHMTFFNQACFDAHHSTYRGQTNVGRTVCSTIQKCLRCEKTYNKDQCRNGHICENTLNCKSCFQKVNPDFHHCTWKPISDKQKEKWLNNQKKFKFVFFDVETVVCDDSGNTEGFEQWVNCLCYSFCCEKCIYEPFEYDGCEQCGPVRSASILHNTDLPKNFCISEFCKILLFDRRFNNCTVLSHFGSIFDEHFVIKQLLEIKLTPKLITRDSAILLMTLEPEPGKDHNSITWKDSGLFMNIALSKMPEAWNIVNEKKGSFPFYANSPQHYGVTFDRHFPKSMYAYSTMSTEAKVEFDSFYDEVEHRSFDFSRELREYCMQDCKLLHLSIAAFCKTACDIFIYNPIIQSCTLASYTFKMLKLNYKEGEVGIISENGMYREKQSKKALTYFRWLEKRDNIQIHHARKGREELISIDGHNYKLDGVCRELKRAYEFVGCFYHGCDIHFNPSSPWPLDKSKTMGQLLFETRTRLQKIEKHLTEKGWSLVIIYEHDLDLEIKTNPQLKNFFSEQRDIGCLLPREAYTGGRCAPFNNYTVADKSKSEKITHLDIASQYPYVMMKFPMPLGSPRILTDVPASEIKVGMPYHGLIKCRVLPPQDIVIGALPYVSNDKKLTFPLCRSCLESKFNGSCPHTNPDDRAIVVNVYTKELEVALSLNYLVLECFELWTWDRWDNRLLNNFLNNLQRLKMEKSGPPRPNMSSEELDIYIATVYRNTGVLLRKEEIVKNTPVRFLAKLMNNVIYGKFGQTSQKNHVELLQYDSDRLLELRMDRFIEILSDITIADGISMVTYKEKHEILKATPYSNVVIAAIITSRGRMLLFEALHRLGKRALYCDTDSCLFLEAPGLDNLQNLRGDFLGRWTIDHDTSYSIEKLVVAAPKVYSYILRHNENNNVKEVCKVKGFTLDHETKKIVNFESIKRLVDDLIEETNEHTLQVSRPMLKRKRFAITSTNHSKRLRAVLDKSWHRRDYTTRPFGFIEK